MPKIQRLIISCLCFGGFYCYAAENLQIEAGDFFANFESINSALGKANVVLAKTTSSVGVDIDGKDNGNRLMPGEELEIPLGAKVWLYRRHSGIRLYPLPPPNEKNGFWIVKYLEGSSFGADSPERKGILIIGQHTTGVSVGKNVRLIAPDLKTAQKILETK